MGEGKVFDENGHIVLEFDIYAHTTARKEALKVVNRLLRKHQDGKVVIKYPRGEKVTVSIKSKR